MLCDQTYIAVGKAVFASQLFESALVPIFEFYKIHSNPVYLQKTKGFISESAYKVPISNIVKILSENENISSEIETKLTLFIYNRNLLIHRWIQENGFPEDNLLTNTKNIIELAKNVENQANELTSMLAKYMVKYAEPEWAASNIEEFKKKMRYIFLEAHNDNE